MNDSAKPSSQAAASAAVSLREAFWYWLRLGFISFGGPAGQISIMHQELVERRRWITERRFLHALNYCMVLPGPEARSSRPISAGSCMGPGVGSLPVASSCCRRFSF
jgi:chromate transporter